MALPDSDYNDALLNATGQRNWLFLGLVLSLALHLLLCLYLYQTRLVPADLALAPRSEPPVFKVKPIDTQAALDKASLDQTNPAAKPEPTKIASLALAISIRCWPKKVRWDRGRRSECRTTSSFNMIARNCRRVRSSSCKSLAR